MVIYRGVSIPLVVATLETMQDKVLIHYHYPLAKVWLYTGEYSIPLVVATLETMQDKVWLYTGE